MPTSTSFSREIGLVVSVLDLSEFLLKAIGLCEITVFCHNSVSRNVLGSVCVHKCVQVLTYTIQH